MMAGLPVVGVAATELPGVITNGVDGYVDTRRERLLECMHQLSGDRDLAQRWGRAARQTALQRFGIERYVRDWMNALSLLTETCHE
jgi:glycosyltransferase involved in cell wall biosynthesis